MNTHTLLLGTAGLALLGATLAAYASGPGDRSPDRAVDRTLLGLPNQAAGGTAAATDSSEGPVNTLTSEEIAAGWKLLFDGKTTNGWRGFRQDTMPDGWKAVDGALTRVDRGGDIITIEQYDNFELALEWKISEGGNSGIFFRVSENEESVWHTGPEFQVLDNAGHRDGSSPVTSAGSDYALHAPLRDVTRPVGAWNHVRILVNGAHVEHWLNGLKVLEYQLGNADWERLVRSSKFARLPRFGREGHGHIALQDHGDPVAYRNIKIRALPGTGPR